MPADFSLPLVTTLYTTYLSTLKERDVDALTLCLSDPSNIPTGAMKWNRGLSKLQEYIAAAWEDKVLSLAGGGTGAATAAVARTNLGLGTLATQNANNVDISGGLIGTLVDISADRLTFGLVSQARLGSGSDAAGLKVLHDDQTYKALPAAFSSGMLIMFAGPSSSTPTGFLYCDGTAVSRTTYSVLFGLIGTTYGAGDGSTTFNVPDLRQRFPLGKSTSGTGVTLGETGGAIDHTHSAGSHTHTAALHALTINSHTHTVASHTHTGPSHTHGISGSTATTSISHTHTGTTGGPSGTTAVSSLDQETVADPTHTHTFTTAASDVVHSHGVGSLVTGAAGTGATGGTPLTTDGTGELFTNISALTTDPGSGATGNANPPYVTVNFIIKT